MQYVYDGEYYKIVRITGPKHNMLGIMLCESQSGEIEVEDLDASLNAHIKLSPGEIRVEVCRGIKEANDEFGTNYKVGKIIYISTDTPPVETYKFLAKEVVRRLVSGESFIKA